MPTDLTPTTLAKPWPTVDKNQLPDRDYGKSENVSGNYNIFTTYYRRHKTHTRAHIIV